MKEKQGTVLVCPLNWGLGHASRCIPLIHALILQHNKVIIAGHGAPIDLLKEEFPLLHFVLLQGTDISYSTKKLTVFKMLVQFPKMIWSVFLEHRQLKRVISEHKIDVVISDNRYGLWSDKIKSILITHQLYIKLPDGWKWMNSLVNAINHFFIRQFNECWVPDESGMQNISGELSHDGAVIPGVKYIGLLSRFNAIKAQPATEKFEVLVMLSGPEPQRSVLEELLIRQLSVIEKSALVIRGKPGEKEILLQIGKIIFSNHLPADLLKFHLQESNFIICRSGYSSLMDLAAIGRSAVIIPTPGQTEQEYLAEYHHNKGHHFMVKQDAINLFVAFAGVSNCRPFLLTNNSTAIVVSSVFINNQLS